MIEFNVVKIQQEHLRAAIEMGTSPLVLAVKEAVPSAYRIEVANKYIFFILEGVPFQFSSPNWILKFQEEFEAVSPKNSFNGFLFLGHEFNLEEMLPMPKNPELPDPAGIDPIIRELVNTLDPIRSTFRSIHETRKFIVKVIRSMEMPKNKISLFSMQMESNNLSMRQAASILNKLYGNSSIEGETKETKAFEDMSDFINRTYIGMKVKVYPKDSENFFTGTINCLKKVDGKNDYRAEITTKDIILRISDANFGEYSIQPDEHQF